MINELAKFEVERHADSLGSKFVWNNSTSGLMALRFNASANLFPGSVRWLVSHTTEQISIDAVYTWLQIVSVHSKSAGYRRDVASSLRSELFQEHFAFEQRWISNEKYAVTVIPSLYLP